MFGRKQKPRRYEARPVGLRFLGVECGGVWDNERDTWARGEGLSGHVTTLSNARREARRANRVC